MDLFVSKIQRFSTADGPGIRTTVFLCGCNLRCKWCHNPETWELKQQTLRFQNGKEEISGVKMSVEEVFEAIMKDIDFYQESAGGLTVSGGEPLLQYQAVAELLCLCKQANINTLIDTAGAVPYTAFRPLIPVTNIFYYDIKAADEKRYKSFTGGSFELIKYNLLKLKSDGANVVLRLPLITGVNTDLKSAEMIAKLAAQAEIREIHLLPYHKFGISKYDALGIDYPFRDKRLVSKKQIDRILKCYKNAGFEVRINSNGG